ncbi:MAG: carboxypeptidase-like regulatory domain-containing protein [Cyclobacteriaceae bacterium]|nr:carboxypeptidase-like regulatory domain-containing protein [Cyclobacteriaceae bacterium]
MVSYRPVKNGLLHNPHRVFKLAATCLLWMGLQCAHAQTWKTEVFTGVVMDSLSFVGLPYVNIQIKSTLHGTSSDAKGRFTVQATRKDTLVFSLIGYTSVEVPLLTYEEGIIRMSEKRTMLNAITILDTAIENPYEGLFEEEDRRWQKLTGKRLPFYYSKERKEKIKVARFNMQNQKAKTYVDLVIKSDELKHTLMERHHLTEKEYYDLLTQFNVNFNKVMYYLTAPELLSMINNFYSRMALQKQQKELEEK